MDVQFSSPTAVTTMLRRPLTFFVLSLVCAPSAFAGGQVLLFPSLGTPQQMTISGRVFDKPLDSGSTRWSRNLRSLRASGVEDVDVHVRFLKQSKATHTEDDGHFEVTFFAPEGEPFVIGPQTVEASALGFKNAQAEADILSPSAPFVVVSDFDDTLIVTEVTRKRRLIWNTLGEDAHSQPVVEGMPELVSCLKKDKQEQPGLALVSGSPQQFIPRIQKFLFKNNFPPFALYLRDVGPSTWSGYKQPILRKILKALPHPIVLLGDSGERDPEVYRQIKQEFPERIKVIAIHDVGGVTPARTSGMLVFKKPKEIAEKMVEMGLISQTCVDGSFE